MFLNADPPEQDILAYDCPLCYKVGPTVVVDLGVPELVLTLSYVQPGINERFQKWNGDSDQNFSSLYPQSGPHCMQKQPLCFFFAHIVILKF